MSEVTTLGFTVTRNEHAKSDQQRQEILANPGFGVHFTDHMVAIDWSKESGWHDSRVIPYGPLQIEPASAVLHYGQEIFEGMKAYRHADGSIWTFRAEASAARFQRSARRIALPELPIELFTESLRQIIAADGDWVPDPSGGAEVSMYLRPFMIANEVFLGVRSAHQAAYYLIASPAGPYFTKGVAPVSIWLNENYVRASQGGTGEAKCGGNYAASLIVQEEAYANGCSQVLFLDGSPNRYIEELGGMNIFFVKKDGSLLTPELSGTILRGITRDSVITIARDRGIPVEERKVTLDEWIEGAKSGEITEVFACGTAAVITPIAQLLGENLQIGDADAEAGELTLSLRKELTDIQYGRIPDRHQWLTRLDG